MLRAEWSLLNRPERIERLAAKYLKLAPAQPRQLITLDRLADRDFERPRPETAGAGTKPSTVPVAVQAPAE